MDGQNRVAELEAQLELARKALSDQVYLYNKTVSDLDERLEQERQLFAEIIDKKLSQQERQFFAEIIDKKLAHLQHENTALRLRCSRQRRELSKLNRAQYMLRTIIRLCAGR